MMILQVILEGIGLGVLLVIVCAIGIRKGAVRNGASLQPGSSEQVRNAGAYNTRKNKAERFAFQSGMRSRIYCLCAGVRLCGERCTGFSCGLLAVACYFIGDEPYGPFSR